jgi:leukotriene-A4 hydrolase
MNRILFCVAALMLFVGCEVGGEKAIEPAELVHEGVFLNDPHSFSNPDEAVTRHLELDLDVNFENQIISGVASYHISKKPGAKKIVFDIDEITIEKITLNSEESGANYQLDKGNDFGQKLTVELYDNTRLVNIHYKTSPSASAVQWLNAQQTSGKIYPFLFTQGQAILTRSWIPCQDSPGIRLTYNAKVKVPQGMMAVMSASNPTKKSESGEYTFEMEQPIPPYLIALAIGDIEFRSTGEKTGVYAEKQLIEAAANEFSDTEKMLIAAEKLYGPYQWERYDVIVLPPSFPFGGMENPRLTFATPTIIAGDKSLTSLVAHELAHSWSGNLVTNANWNDFWMNEGFTVYFEKRIMEELYGRDYAEMLNLLGHQDLVRAVEELQATGGSTKLKLDLEGMDPDDGMTDIAYEKGYFFLRLLEETVGREKFDVFLKGYFEEFAFKTITTEVFLEYLNENLITPNNLAVNVNEWVFEEGIPASCPKVVSNRFSLVELELAKWEKGEISAKEINSGNWSTHEWLHFVRNLKNETNLTQMAELDEAFGFTTTGNSEIKAAWFERSIKNNYERLLMK